MHVYSNRAWKRRGPGAGGCFVGLGVWPSAPSFFVEGERHSLHRLHHSPRQQNISAVCSRYVPHCCPVPASISVFLGAGMAEAFAASSPFAWYEVRRLLAAITTLEVMVLVAIMFAASVPSQDWAAVATNTTATAEDLDASPSAGQDSGRRRGRGRRRRELYHVDVTEAGEPCKPSPLWDRVVDPANYDYGCREIQVRLNTARVYMEVPASLCRCAGRRKTCSIC